MSALLQQVRTLRDVKNEVILTHLDLANTRASIEWGNDKRGGYTHSCYFDPERGDGEFRASKPEPGMKASAVRYFDHIEDALDWLMA